MNKTLAVKVLALCLACFVIGGFVVYATTPTTTQVLGGGNYPGTVEYTIFTDGTNIYGKNALGTNEFSGTDADDVINDCISALDSAGGDQGGSILITQGTYDIDDPIEINDLDSVHIYGEGTNTLLDVDGAIPCFNITSSDYTVIADMEIYGNYPTLVASAIGINITDSDEGLYENLYIVGLAWGIKINLACYANEYTNIRMYLTGCGIQIRQANGSHFNKIDVVDSTNGVVLNQSTCYGLFFYNLIVESCDGYGLEINAPIMGGGLWGGYFDQCNINILVSSGSFGWSSPTRGFVISGIYNDDATLYGLHIVYAENTCIQGGYYLDSGTYEIYNQGKNSTFINPCLETWTIEDDYPEGQNSTWVGNGVSLP